MPEKDQLDEDQALTFFKGCQEEVQNMLSDVVTECLFTEQPNEPLEWLTERVEKWSESGCTSDSNRN